MDKKQESRSREKVFGVFAGIAIGDALGMPVETLSAQEIAEKYGRITAYRQPLGHKWYDGWEAGRWTDDTQLSLAIALSLIENKGGINLADLAWKHVNALDECSIGWGRGTKTAVNKLKTGVNYRESGTKDSSGNGVAMKVSPIGLKLAADFMRLGEEKAHRSNAATILSLRDLSLMTHGSAMATASAFAQAKAVFCSVIYGDTVGFDERFLNIITNYCLFAECGYSTSGNKLSERMKELLGEDKLYKRRTVLELARCFDGAGCYVYESLPFCYAAFLRNKESIDTLYDVVNAGGDTDSNGSIVGALLGAYNGIDIFPRHLIDGLWQKERVMAVAEEFWECLFANI